MRHTFLFLRDLGGGLDGPAVPRCEWPGESYSESSGNCFSLRIKAFSASDRNRGGGVEGPEELSVEDMGE